MERTWKPDEIVEAHGHPFDVDALLVTGELWLTCDGSVRHLVAGDAYRVPRNLPHSERYGAMGATAWVARTLRASFSRGVALHVTEWCAPMVGEAVIGCCSLRCKS